MAICNGEMLYVFINPFTLIQKRKIQQNQPHQAQFCSLSEKAAVNNFCTKKSTIDEKLKDFAMIFANFIKNYKIESIGKDSKYGPTWALNHFFQKYNKTSPIKHNSAPYMKKLPPGSLSEKAAVNNFCTKNQQLMKN